MSEKLRELIAKWRFMIGPLEDPGTSAFDAGTASGYRTCADELEALLAENAPEQAQEGLPTDVGHKFVVANGVMRFLAQAISRLDDVAQPATAKAEEGNAGGRKETSVPHVKEPVPLKNLPEEWDKLEKYYSDLASAAPGAGYDNGSFTGKAIGISICAAQLRAALSTHGAPAGEWDARAIAERLRRYETLTVDVLANALERAYAAGRAAAPGSFSAEQQVRLDEANWWYHKYAWPLESSRKSSVVEGIDRIAKLEDALLQPAAKEQP